MDSTIKKIREIKQKKHFCVVIDAQRHSWTQIEADVPKRSDDGLLVTNKKNTVYRINLLY